MCKKPDRNQYLQFSKTTSQTAGCKLTTKSVSKCDSGWTHQGTSCYKKMTTAVKNLKCKFLVFYQKQLFQASFDAARRDCACTNSGDLVSIHTLEENRFIEKLAGSTEVFNFQFYSCILSTFLFQRSGLEAETLSLKVPTCIFACRSKTNWIYLG